MQSWQRALVLSRVLPFVLLLCYQFGWAEEPAVNTVGPGRVVAVTYTVSLTDGKIVHSNVDGYPLKYKQGDGKLLPALEAALAGLTVGDKKSVTLAPAEAYPVKAELIQEVPLERIPKDSRHVGAVFRPMGARGSVRVTDVSEDAAILDFNHPLAGKTLTYDITIVAVE